MTATDKTAVAFNLDYLAYEYDQDGREQWRMEWRAERVYLLRHVADNEYTVHRLADDKLIGCGDTKQEACQDAYLRLMNATRRAGAPLAYKRVGE